jgi:hypothetical protein
MGIDHEHTHKAARNILISEQFNIARICFSENDTKK